MCKSPVERIQVFQHLAIELIVVGCLCQGVFLEGHQFKDIHAPFLWTFKRKRGNAFSHLDLFKFLNLTSSLIVYSSSIAILDFSFAIKNYFLVTFFY